MRVITEQVVCNLRSARKAKGISQTDLAARVGVKRQAIYDIENGRYLPNTALALRIAKVLNCKVEDLFLLDEPGDQEPITLVEKTTTTNTRVSLARVRDRLIAYPLDGKWLLTEGFQAADGLLAPDCGRVQPFFRGGELDKNVFVLGCDPALAILGERASKWSADARVQSRFASSRLALERVASGYAHIAGTHLHNTASVESNVAYAQAVLSGLKAVVFAFSFFEEGLVVAPGNPHRIRTVEDLCNPGIRFVNREPGAALRILLDELLAKAGIPGERINGYDTLVSSHNWGARMVAFDMADAALGLRAVATAHGLDFVTLEAVRCDLVIPCDLLDLPAVKAVLDVLQTKSLRDELSALPGYDSSCTGKIVGWV